MGKRVIRLTEADIENIVKKVIKEQNQNEFNEFKFGNVNMGGLFQIKGNELWFRLNESEEPIKIWDTNAVPTFKVENNQFVPDGYLKIQYDLFFNYTNENDVFNRRRAIIDVGGNQKFTIPNTRQVSENIPYIMLRDDGKLQGMTTEVRVISKNLLQDTARLGSYGVVVDKLNKSRENVAKFRETYVNVRRDRFAVVFRGFGLVARPITPTPPPENIKLSLNLQDVFKFDTIDFENPEAESKINEFAQQIKNGINDERYGDSFRRQMNAKLARNPILGYASIDGDPEGDVPENKGYRPCSGQKRKDYNKCLSEARAKRVADILNEKFSDDNMINFKYKGMGETDQLSDPKGKKWPDYKYNETGENRKIILNLGEFRLRV